VHVHVDVRCHGLLFFESSDQAFDNPLRANNGSLDQTADHTLRADSSLDAQKPVKAVAKKSTSKPQMASVHVEPPKQPQICEDSQSSSAHSAKTDRRLAGKRRLRLGSTRFVNYDDHCCLDLYNLRGGLQWCPSPLKLMKHIQYFPLFPQNL